ncbi:MAG: 2'-5' RNA ligase family protein [Pseudomonadota bacterium]
MPRAISIKATGVDNKPLIELWDAFGYFERLPSMPSLNYPPHITLAIYSDLETDAAAIDELAADQIALKLSFAHLDCFRIPRFVVWAKPDGGNDALVRLHRKLHSLVNPLACHEHYRPGNWIPHCTLATDIPLETEHRALARMAEPFVPFEVVFNAIDYVEFPPVRVLHQVQLPFA